MRIAEIDIKGIRTKIDSMGLIRWAGQWFTPWEVPPNHILLNDEQFNILCEIRREHDIRPGFKE